ncbi:YwhD family protein [Bacillus massiliigorillae]|uniref:YwhD family protein n=1 Tax=Bacillus massiliigorillae TaxID=1243664 RepID=UPI00039F8A02|nr:YwhD family protein [Bacillus massiliigorillae]
MKSNDSNTPKSKAQFNIIKNDPTNGDGSYGVGALSLENITSIIVDPENNEAYIDMEAMHGRSKIEKKVRFQKVKEGLIDPKLYWIVWVALNRGKDGPYYSGIGACEVLVSSEERRIRLGYKSMPEQVNSLSKVLKSKCDLTKMDDVSKIILKDFLIKFNEDYWKYSSDDFKNIW